MFTTQGRENLRDLTLRAVFYLVPRWCNHVTWVKQLPDNNLWGSISDSWYSVTETAHTATTNLTRSIYLFTLLLPSNAPPTSHGSEGKHPSDIPKTRRASPLRKFGILQCQVLSVYRKSWWTDVCEWPKLHDSNLHFWRLMATIKMRDSLVGQCAVQSSRSWPDITEIRAAFIVGAKHHQKFA